MKKQKIAILGLFLLISSLTGCNVTNGNSQIQLNATEQLVERNIVKSVNELEAYDYELKVGYYYGNYYVWQFYLGQVTRVPLKGVLSDDVYEYRGGNITYSFSTTKTTTDTVSEGGNKAKSTAEYVETDIGSSINVTVGNETEAKVKVFSFAEASVNEKFEIDVSTSLSEKVGYESTMTESQSYEKANSNSESSTKTTTISFDSSCEQGYYRYVYMGNYDVFATIVLNLETETYEVHEHAYCFSTSICLDYSPSAKFVDNSLDELHLDKEFLNDLEVPQKQEENESNEDTGNSDEVSENVKDLYLDTNPLSCADNNGYDYTKPHPNENDDHYAFKEQFVNFKLSGLVKENDGYKAAKGYNSTISFMTLHNSENLPLQDNMTKRAVYDDTYEGSFYNMPYDIGRMRAGKGLLVALIEYKDGTPADKIIKENVLQNTKNKDEIIVATEISKACTINIVLCYEIEMWAPGFLGISGQYWINYRINQTFNIVV